MTTKISDEAVETVARAIWDAKGYDPDALQYLDEPHPTWEGCKEEAHAALTAALAHFAAHPEQLPEGFWYAPVEGPKPDDCPACFGSGKTVRPQIPQTCGECGGSGKV